MANPSARLTLLILVLVIISFSTFLPLADNAVLASGTAQDTARTDAIERQLKPRRVIAGDETKTWTLAERMRHYHVPGVSIAVIEGGSVTLAKGYGERAAGSGLAVTPNTRFQAASVSKSVAALGALLLMQAGRLDLNANVNNYLTRWHLPPMEGNQTLVTALMLMSHTAGLTVHGFPGYASADQVPAIEQVLDGAPPANTDPVRISTPPGTIWRYSGGGFTILQLLIEEISGSTFAHYLRTSVLEPLGMENSGFETLPADAEDVAFAHDGRGALSGDRWHTYPELAAAGLWTTPTDLGRFLIALLSAGDSGNPVAPESVHLMTTPVRNNYALGIIVSEEKGETIWTHSGGNWGYRCVYKVWPQRKLGIIVMTNGDNGGNLYQEIVDAFARHSGLPVEPQAVFPVNTSITAVQQEACAGHYEIPQIGISFEAYMQDGNLYIRSDTTPVWRLYPRTDSYYFSLDDNVEVVFKRDESGRVTGATVILNGRSYIAERRE